MVRAFLLSLAQLGDRRILAVFLKSMLVTVALIGVLGAGLWYGATRLADRWGWDSLSGGLLGAVALLSRSVLAIPLTTLSLVGVVLQFGWLFATSDIVAVKGAWTAIFPLVIVAIAAASVWLARHARRRGWIV